MILLVYGVQFRCIPFNDVSERQHFLAVTAQGQDERSNGDEHKWKVQDKDAEVTVSQTGDRMHL